MALTTLPGQGVWIPTKADEGYQIGGSPYVIDATGEKFAVTFMAPKSGNLTRFETTITTLGNAPDNGLKCSFQSASSTDGLATGTILGAGAAAHVTTAGGSPSATGWFNPGDFGAVVAVTAGDILCAVIEFGGAGWVTPDSVGFGGTNRCGNTSLPFAMSATSTKNTSTFPIIALRYDDGTYCMADDEIWPGITHNDFDIDTGTSQNEAGLRFTVPVSMRLRAVEMFMLFAATSAEFELYLYDSGGSTVAGPITIDGDISSSATGLRFYLFVLPAPITLTANSEYVIAYKPTTTVNVRLFYYTFNSLEIMDSIPGGSEWYAIARAWSGGTPAAWTRYNTGTFRRPRVYLGFDAIDGDTGTPPGSGTRRVANVRRLGVGVM